VPGGVSLGKVGVGKGVEVGGTGVFVGDKGVGVAFGVAVTMMTTGVSVEGTGEIAGSTVLVAWVDS